MHDKHQFIFLSELNMSLSFHWWYRTGGNVW